MSYQKEIAFLEAYKIVWDYLMEAPETDVQQPLQDVYKAFIGLNPFRLIDVDSLLLELKRQQAVVIEIAITNEKLKRLIKDLEEIDHEMQQLTTAIESHKLKS